MSDNYLLRKIFMKYTSLVLCSIAVMQLVAMEINQEEYGSDQHLLDSIGKGFDGEKIELPSVQQLITFNSSLLLDELKIETDVNTRKERIASLVGNFGVHANDIVEHLFEQTSDTNVLLNDYDSICSLMDTYNITYKFSDNQERQDRYNFYLRCIYRNVSSSELFDKLETETDKNKRKEYIASLVGVFGVKADDVVEHLFEKTSDTKVLLNDYDSICWLMNTYKTTYAFPLSLERKGRYNFYMRCIDRNLKEDNYGGGASKFKVSKKNAPKKRISQNKQSKKITKK